MKKDKCTSLEKIQFLNFNDVPEQKCTILLLFFKDGLNVTLLENPETYRKVFSDFIGKSCLLPYFDYDGNLYFEFDNDKVVRIDEKDLSKIVVEKDSPLCLFIETEVNKTKKRVQEAHNVW